MKGPSDGSAGISFLFTWITLLTLLSPIVFQDHSALQVLLGVFCFQLSSEQGRHKKGSLWRFQGPRLQVANLTSARFIDQNQSHGPAWMQGPCPQGTWNDLSEHLLLPLSHQTSPQLASGMMIQTQKKVLILIVPQACNLLWRQN